MKIQKKKKFLGGEGGSGWGVRFWGGGRVDVYGEVKLL